MYLRCFLKVGFRSAKKTLGAIDVHSDPTDKYSGKYGRKNNSEFAF